MTLRADHVAGAFFVGLGLLVIALSGDLPTGNLSMPGSGFLPKIVAVLTIFFGAVLTVRARESKAFATLTWDDAKHAAMVVAITAAGIAVFEWLGFLTSNVLLIFALLVIVERRQLLRRTSIASASYWALTCCSFTRSRRHSSTGPLGF